MLLQNQTYPEDVRVRAEAESLTGGGHEVLVIAPRGAHQATRETVNGVSVWRYRAIWSGGSLTGFAAEYLLAHAQLFMRGLVQLSKGATVVHLHNPPDTLFPIGAAARLLRRKVVFDQHDLFPELYREKFGHAPTVERILRLAQRATVTVATTVIVTNESQKQSALRVGAKAKRITVVRNGPRRETLSDFSGGRAGPLRDPRLLFLGELDFQDGVVGLPSLLAAIRQNPETPEATLTIVGDGARRADVEREIAAAGLGQAVTLTGRVEHTRIPLLLDGADICLDPAPCSELNHRSTMIKIAEYLAAGRPVVAYELIETERTAGPAALYATCGDADAFVRQVVALASDPDLRKRLARAGGLRIHDLVWEESESFLLEAYARL